MGRKGYDFGLSTQVEANGERSGGVAKVVWCV